MAGLDLETRRHSAAHAMAAAVKRLYPDAQFDIGPATEDGYYYDFDIPSHRLTDEDLPRIEEAMKEIVAEKAPFVCLERSRQEAAALLRGAGQPYKLERLGDIPEGESITFYECAGFTDLCRGPHVEHTGQIGAFKLLSVAGSYFRGDEANKMLQRVYGTAFADRKALKKYLNGLEEARKRDHRRLGRELDLFSVSENVGPGLICWHPKGGRIRNIIEQFWRDEHYRAGYDILYTPHIGLAKLWETSGHLDFYSESMYAAMEIDKRDYYVKPMNCPFHIEIYKTRNRSYRELPLRWGELGTVYRYEKGGVLHGLLRVRGFTQDDAHIICTPEQVDEEIQTVLRFSLEMWRCFGFENVQAYVSTRPAKSVGEESRWQQASESLRKAVDAVGLPYEMDEGGGAFYGPKIDLKINDALGREWQTSTIQFDFNLPERFDMTYVGSDGQKHRPYVVHRALLGSIERFFGILVEHHAGAFPAWLAPEQARILPVGEDFADYAKSVEADCRKAELRTSVDLDADTLGAKIRRARNERIPYILVVGEREQASQQVAVRTRADGNIGAIPLRDFIARISAEIREKR